MPAGEATTTLQAHSAAPAREGRRRRADIEGLRAVAVLLVLGFHAGIPQLAGGFVGVDVFFVISGFLITGLMVREIETTGRLSLTRFWARRAKRLLPAAAVVLSAVAVMTVVALPATRWKSTAWDIATSATYVVNWRLAQQSVDYLASDNAPSPVQHFWSLAVEEQFYILWPVLILGLVMISHKRRWRLRSTLLAGVVVLALCSFAWSVSVTERSPGQAYFVTTTRLWELGIGAALAILAPLVAAMPRRAATPLAGAGIAAIVAAALLYDAATAFPSYTAALPTLGAAAVIAAGLVNERTGIGRLLSTGPMVEIGGLSYSLYLWHWPFLVGATAAYGGDDGELPVPLAVVVAAASAVPAWFTYKVIERPIHFARILDRFHFRALGVGAACTAFSLLAAVAVTVVANRPPSYSADAQAPGAAVLGDDPSSFVAPDSVRVMVPDPVRAAEDRATLGGNRCIQGPARNPFQPCVYGPADAETVIAVIGDSKMDQWLDALEPIADARGWRLITGLINACPLARVDITSGDGDVYETCGEYNEARYDLLRDPEIDYVLTSQRATRAYVENATQAERRATLLEDMQRTWTELEASGKEVLVLLDNPSPSLNVMECVAKRPSKLTSCAFDRAQGLKSSGAAVQLPAAKAVEGVQVIDMADWICPGEKCPAVVGNVLVYRQGSHLTTTYVKSLTPYLDAALSAAMSSG